MDEYRDSVADSAEVVAHDWCELGNESHKLYRKHGVTPSSAADAIAAAAEDILKIQMAGDRS